MTIRRTGMWRVACAAAVSAVLLGASACSGDSSDKGNAKPSSSKAEKGRGNEQGEDEETASSAPLAEVKNGDIALAVSSAARDDGGFVTVSGTVTNSGSKFWAGADWMSDERELTKNGASLAGASLVDPEGKKKYLVLRDTSGRCLCTKFPKGGVEAGGSEDWYAQFPAPPEAATEVKFQVGSMPPATIQLSAGE